MGNEVTTKSNSYLTSNAAYAEMFAAEAQRVGSGSGGGHMFLKFDGNTGDYTYGASNEELPLGTLLALDIKTYKRGFICWDDGKVVDEIMMTLEEGPPPAKSALPDHGPYTEENDGWGEQLSIEMKMIDDPFINMLFQANNESKRRAFKAMMNDFMKGFKMHEGCTPIIEVDEVEFEGKAKKGSKKYRKHAPVFKIVDWKDDEELAALTEGAAEDYEEEEEKPAATSRRTARVEADEEEDERPARRTRAAPVEEEEDEKPARRSTRRAEAEANSEEEEDERPARRASRRDEDEEEAEERPRAAAGRRRPSF